MQQITIYSATDDTSTPRAPPNNWNKLAECNGTDSYNPVAVMILPTAKTVRHLAVMTGNWEGIINLKEVQVFGCIRKYIVKIILRLFCCFLCMFALSAKY